MKNNEMEVEEIILFKDTDLNSIKDIISTMEQNKHITKWVDNFMGESDSNYRVEIKKVGLK